MDKFSEQDSQIAGSVVSPKVPNHINYALVEQTRPAMYRAFKYWGKKPHNIFRAYIEAYTNPGDIVLDAFAGSGVAPLEAVQAGRKAVAIDYNPLSVFMMKVLSTKFDKSRFVIEYEKIMTAAKQEEVKTEFFFTKCRVCGNKKARVTGVHWGDIKSKKGSTKFHKYVEGLGEVPSVEQFIEDMNLSIPRNGSVPVLVRYECPPCNKKEGKIADKEDAEIIRKSEMQQIPYWIPDDEFPKTIPFEVVRRGVGRYYSGLWTKRVLWLTAFIYKKIESVEDEKTRNFLKFAFISSVHLSSKMVASRQPKTERPDSGSWGRSAYILLSWHMEQNPVVLFQRAVEGRNGILNAKKSSNTLLGDNVKFAKNIDGLREEKKDKNLLIMKLDVLDLSQKLGNNSIDYVITDPPYGGLVQYFSLSSIWTVWLKHGDDSFEMHYDGEITMNDKNDFHRYHAHLTRALREIRKVLKPGGYMTLTFHNKEISVWNSVIRAGYDAGFHFEKIIYQPNKRAGETGVAMPYTTSTSDYYLRFKKPELEIEPRNGFEVGARDYEKVVVESAKRIIAHRGEPTELMHILNGIFADLYTPGRIFEGEVKDIVRILDGEVGTTFITSPGGGSKSKHAKWWLKDTTGADDPLSERVERVVISTLRENHKVTFDDVLGKLFIEFPNGLTPETSSVQDVLKKHAKKDGRGYWRYEPKLTGVESKHSEMIYILSKLGKKFDLKVWVGKREHRDTYKGKNLSDLCTEESLKLQGITQPAIERIQNIDVVWYNDVAVRCIFEVENSTGFLEAIARGSHVPSESGVWRFFVIPDERSSELEKKLKDPAVRGYCLQYGWRAIQYSNLREFSRTRKSELSDLYDIGEQLL